jgi:hypothetical protein
VSDVQRREVRFFKSPLLALQDLKKFISQPDRLRTGKPLKQFNEIRPREFLANWLLCAAINGAGDREVKFVSYRDGGDGLIWDVATEIGFETEHVMIRPSRVAKGASTHSLILNAVIQKQKKGGLAYASGKTLVVFIWDNGGAWFPRRVARELPQPLLFEAVWVVGLVKVEGGAYTYGVSCLTAESGDVAVFLVTIPKEFDMWSVTRVPQD